MIEIRDFLGMLEQVIPHMSKDDTLPSLCGIRIETDRRNLYAVATDRYTMAIARRRLEEEQAPCKVWLTADTVKTVKAFARAVGRITAVRLETIASKEGMRLLMTADRQSLEVDADLPPERTDASRKWREYVAEALQGEPSMSQEVGLNPTFVARWGKVGGNEPFTVWTAGPGKPVVFARGGDFMGLQMPVRFGTDAGTRDNVRQEWADLLGEVPEPAKPSALLDRAA